MGLEDRLRGLDPFGRIGRQQGQASERRLDGAAQPVVEPHGGGAIRHGRNRLAGRRVQILAVGLGDIDFLGVGIGHQPAILQRADDRIGQRIGAGSDRAYGLFGIGKLVIGEFADGVLERPGHGRQRSRENQKDRQ